VNMHSGRHLGVFVYSERFRYSLIREGGHQHRGDGPLVAVGLSNGSTVG